MLIFDLKLIGNRLYEIRTRKLPSRSAVAEKADLSERTYADIERGNVNMRLETLLKICTALNITPNDILVDAPDFEVSLQDITTALNGFCGHEKATALKLLRVYLDSLQ